MMGSFLLVTPMLLLARSVSSGFSVSARTATRPALQCLYSSSSTGAPTVTEGGILVVSEMPPPLPDLKNQFYLLRHGQSEGNVEGVISSARSLATSEKHSLTELGYVQARDSAVRLLDRIESEGDGGTADKKRRVFFYGSPFARARQTAQACMEALVENEDNKQRVEDLHLDVQTNAGVILEDGVMERFFGRLDGEPLHTYGYVWPVDMEDVTNTVYDVESVAAVSTRIRETVTRIDKEERHSDSEEADIIVMASHADVLQIAQVYAAGADNVGTFSSYRFMNGEVRKMKRTVDSLPEPQPLEPPAKGT